MNKIQKYEKSLIKLYWVFIVLLITLMVIKLDFYFDADVIIRQNIMLKIFTVSLVILNFVKLRFINNEELYSDKVFDVFRFIEVFLFSFFMIDFNEGLEYLVLIIPLVFSSIYRGKRIGLFLISFSLMIKLGYIFIHGIIINQNILNSTDFRFEIFRIILIYVVLIAIIKVTLNFSVENSKNEKENVRLVIELGEKYEQLEVAKNEIKNQYNKLIETNHKL